MIDRYLPIKYDTIIISPIQVAECINASPSSVPQEQSSEIISMHQKYSNSEIISLRMSQRVFESFSPKLNQSINQYQYSYCICTIYRKIDSFRLIVLYQSGTCIICIVSEYHDSFRCAQQNSHDSSLLPVSRVVVLQPPESLYSPQRRMGIHFIHVHCIGDTNDSWVMCHLVMMRLLLLSMFQILDQ